jgi:hypothetical protein
MASIYLFGKERGKLMERMLAASSSDCIWPWLKPIGNPHGQPGRTRTFSTISVEAAFARFCAGERPPLLPCELTEPRSERVK